MIEKLDTRCSGGSPGSAMAPARAGAHKKASTRLAKANMDADPDGGLRALIALLQLGNATVARASNPTTITKHPFSIMPGKLQCGGARVNPFLLFRVPGASRDNAFAQFNPRPPSQCRQAAHVQQLTRRSVRPGNVEPDVAVIADYRPDQLAQLLDRNVLATRRYSQRLQVPQNRRTDETL